MRTFEKFPQERICPLCGTNEDKECFLIPIDGTAEGNICEAVPVHVSCLISDEYRMNKEHGIIYRFFKDPSEV